MLFVGDDDWAEDHHDDVEVQDETGRRLGTARLEEGITGIDRLHTLLATHTGPDADPDQVVIGIETERGPWVQALLAAGYRVHAINPLQVARYRERQTISGAKSDAGDAHALADMVRTDGHQLRTIAGDSDTAAAIKVVARAHKTLVWERTRHMLRLRHALHDFFPAALAAFDDLTAPDTLELLSKAPDPTAAARLTTTQITAAPAPRTPPQRRDQGHRDPGGSTNPAPGPTRPGHRRLRHRRPLPGSDPGHPARRDHHPAGPG